MDRLHALASVIMSQNAGRPFFSFRHLGSTSAHMPDLRRIIAPEVGAHVRRVSGVTVRPRQIFTAGASGCAASSGAGHGGPDPFPHLRGGQV